ncbi:hypothetical protein M2282_000057 [Variovorax boronicumulans]|nr:hypothetical protein [Variovorax boronicumulans]
MVRDNLGHATISTTSIGDILALTIALEAGDIDRFAGRET